MPATKAHRSRLAAGTIIRQRRKSSAAAEGITPAYEDTRQHQLRKKPHSARHLVIEKSATQWHGSREKHQLAKWRSISIIGIESGSIAKMARKQKNINK